MMPKVGKKHFSYTKKGIQAAKAYAVKKGKKLDEIGSVGLQRIMHKRRRTKGDPMSVGKVTTKHQAAAGFRTEGEREANALRLRQQQTRGKMGGGASQRVKNRRLGFGENTMNGYSRIYEILTEGDWIQGAINPAHKGYCTPMTKKTCTPHRKALAKRFKKVGKREKTKAGGKTGWKGKV